MKKINSSNLLILAVDNKFKSFDYDRFEISYLKKYLNIVIWDISLISNSYFNKKISAKLFKGDELKIIKSYRELISNFIFIKKKYANKNIFVMNFVSPSCFSSLFFLIMIDKLGFKTIKYDNSGVPKMSTKKMIKTKSYIFKRLLSWLYQLILSFFNIYPTYCVYAGEQRFKETKLSKHKTQFIKGNSWDYSRILTKTNKTLKRNIGLKKKGVLLDGAGPKFNSDDLFIGKKTFLTSDEWYPSLVSFLDKVEKKTNSKIDIAAHPKTFYNQKNSTFGNRPVLYEKALKLVYNSDFVITRQSTAISYAIIFKKPVVFIYSNQLKKDNFHMLGIQTLSKLLGTKPININEKLSNISKYLRVNKNLYEKYKKNYLTSENFGRSNAQILLEDILLINNLKK